MPRKLWPSSRPRGTLSGNGYRKEQLVRGQLWFTVGKRHEQWYRSKIRSLSPFSCFQGHFGSGNNRVSFALYIAPAGNPASYKMGAALHFCRTRRELQQSHDAGSMQSLASLMNPSPLRAGLTWVVLASEQNHQCRGELSNGTVPLHSSMTASPVLVSVVLRKDDKLHQRQVSSYIDICQYPNPLGFPTEFSLFPLNWKMDSWL